MRFEDLGLVNTAVTCVYHQEHVWLRPVVFFPQLLSFGHK